MHPSFIPAYRREVPDYQAAEQARYQNELAAEKMKYEARRNALTDAASIGMGTADIFQNRRARKDQQALVDRLFPAAGGSPTSAALRGGGGGPTGFSPATIAASPGGMNMAGGLAAPSAPASGGSAAGTAAAAAWPLALLAGAGAGAYEFNKRNPGSWKWLSYITKPFGI